MASQIKKPFISEPILTVSAPPHWHCGRSVSGLMIETILALSPVVLMAILQFGIEALRIMALSCVVAVVTEALCLKITGLNITIDDYSSLLTGLLFAFLLPASAPWWLVTVGSSLSIILGRILFGGPGASPLCAPLVAWVVCKISWKYLMDMDLSMLDTEYLYPLSRLKLYGPEAASGFNYLDLFLGKQVGGLGAVQLPAVLLGGLYLILRKHIRPHIPLAFLAGVCITASLYFFIDHTRYADPFFHLITGSVIFGAFFLATDSASSPVGHLPMVLYGFTGGILVIIIRVYSVYPDGVPFAILLANLLTPIFDRIRPKPFQKK
ncbi:MAG: RnfABCDGE type electron transport complex subunit D [Thermodesulfobacteriota bacterium]|nr:RnfABCDGE type electron transport complex subunit D [Thermodesulfobacteriota bacterium]